MISVLTPAFNAAGTLRRAHDSLLVQECRAWEHIIVNDGSTDATAEVIAQLSRDPRVIPLSKPNGGPGSALNAGIRAATGSYIAFLDADDEFLPQHLSAHIAAMEKDPTVDLFWGGAEVIADRVEETLVPDVETGHGLISVSECVVQGTLFARRRIFDTCLFTEDRAIWWQDYEFVQRVRRDYNVQRFYSATYRYYRNSGNSLIDRVIRSLELN
ncbi:MAG: glycosyl transferase [Bryobacterales bacterium]|nr:glycosyl transferase [Bryobacterales bacterium]